MIKKRICLIGAEISSSAGATVQLSQERVKQVSIWAEKNGFDCVWVVTSSSGLVGPADFSGQPERSLTAMSKCERSAWAESICSQAEKLWGSPTKVGEFVLLAHIVGYQELAQTLLALRSGMVVTMPVAGTKIVPGMKKIDSSRAVSV